MRTYNSYSVNFKEISLILLSNKVLKSFGSLVFSAVVVSALVFYIYGRTIDYGGELSGMAIGLYTGGTPNLNALGNIFKLEIPIIKQNLFSVFSIIFSLCFLSFAIVMVLGGAPLNSTIEVAIYQFALFELNFNK